MPPAHAPASASRVAFQAAVHPGGAARCNAPFAPPRPGVLTAAAFAGACRAAKLDGSPAKSRARISHTTRTMKSSVYTRAPVAPRPQNGYASVTLVFGTCDVHQGEGVRTDVGASPTREH
jgi:hypothetical protein